ncbi:ABC transporter substrate-binding protein [Actinomadura mexicana]|uniref:ABC-type transport system, substrate-binding protein n=1 Tax=Actinomadura mexicana TaxID=134959 RepID=A0A239AB90_9ACTN|nr:ABC transporter substrate-binding protein [Actinomadura mexicana]SNR92133.1 ABC-type transport system, substrate-binding protein [Actinomadura mexicana]
MTEVAPLRKGDPSRLGAYRLTGLLGEGGQGAVYLGEDEPGHRVAVKLLHARFSGDPKARSRFAAEVAVAKRVSAFCTARVLDSDVEGDRPYIVSEYIDGPALSRVLAQDGPRRGADLDRLAIGTMTALAAIHQAGVVHRDFKPANVLLAPDGPRVIDFGIARALDATGTMSSTAVGTPAYMAPEQISGARVGPPADVFAWGATMAYAASGRPAFGQDSIPAVMHRILNLPPDLGDLPEPLRGIVANCLSKDPALRPASQMVLAHLLALAGSLPQPGARQNDALMLTQGAQTAATESARLRTRTPPPFQAGPPVPHPAPHAPPHTPPHTPPLHTPPHAPPPLPGAEWPSPVPPPNENTPATWPSVSAPGVDFTKPSGGGKRPRIGVLASVGGAALAVLVLAAGVAWVQLREDGDRGATATGGRVGGTLPIAMSTPTATDGGFDPSRALGGTERFLSKQLFTGLTEVGADGAARNRLATAITPDAECRKWTISLKYGTSFTNGEAVDAHAFARGWARSAADKTGPASYLMIDIEGYTSVSDSGTGLLSGVTVVSGTALEVALTSPNCDFAARLSEPAFMPVPEAAGKVDNAAFNTRPIGNGPFMLADYRKGASVSLVRNDRWAFGKTKLDGVTVMLTDDSAKGRTAYTAGQTDWYAVGTEDLASTPRTGLVSRPAPFTRMLVPITARGPMKSREARQAVSYALDRGRLSLALGGFPQPAHGIVPAPVPGFGQRGVCPSCDATDIEKAKTLATQAGLKSPVRLYYRQSPVDQRLAAAVGSQLKSALGLQVEMKSYPISEFTKYRDDVMSGDASGLAFLPYGPDYPGAYTMLWPLLGGGEESDTGFYNLGKWRNGTFDETISKALRTAAPADRTGLFKQAERVALDDMALIPLLNDTRVAMVRPGKYVGLELDYDGDPTAAAAALK